MKFNIEKSAERCSDLNLKRVLNKLVPYNRYLYFHETTQEEYKRFINEITGDKPDQIKAWYSMFNGGILFDTSFLSTVATDYNVMLVLIKFKHLDNPRKRAQMELPVHMTPFALSSFGDIYCYNNQGLNEIYQWSIAEHKLVYKWINFATWLKDEIEAAIDLVAENIFIPTGYNID